MASNLLLDWVKLQGYRHHGEDVSIIRRHLNSRKITLQNDESEYVDVVFTLSKRKIRMKGKSSITLGIGTHDSELESVILIGPSGCTSPHYYLHTNSNLFVIRKGSSSWILTYFKTPSIRA